VVKKVAAKTLDTLKTKNLKLKNGEKVELKSFQGKEYLFMITFSYLPQES